MEKYNMLEKALEYAEMGFAVFPVNPTNKKPHTPHGCTDAKTDPGAINFWWNKWKDSAIGIATGSVSGGLIVVDLDHDEDKGLDGYAEIEQWQKDHGPFPDTWRSITGRGGYHLFFRSDKPFKNRTGVLDGVDVRGEGGYIIAPPSLHPNGRRYEWEYFKDDAPLAVINDSVETLLTYGLQQDDEEREKFELPDTIPQGKRNDILFKYACSLQSKGVPNDAVRDYLIVANQARCEKPLDNDEVLRIVDSALQYDKGGDMVPSFSGWREPMIQRHTVRRNGKDYEVPDQTIDNCVEAITYDRDLFNRIKYNQLAYSPTVCGALPWNDSTVLREWNNADDAHLKNYLEENYGLKSTEKIMDALTIVTDRHKFNPVIDMLEEQYRKYQEAGKPIGYIKKLLPEYLGAEDTEFTYQVMRIFMLGAISRVYHPGCKFDYTLILVGKQSAGKSTFLRFLSMSNTWFNDNFNTIETDKAAEKLRGMWMVEMAELLAAKRAKDVESIKSFLTSTEDSFRPPYQRRTEQRRRMCVFAGTTNNDHFLSDRTGNRRFLPITVSKEKAPKPINRHRAEVAADIAMAWGEAMQIFYDADQGPDLVLPEEIEKTAEEMQAKHMEEDTRIGIIQNWLDNCGEEKVCVAQIWECALGNDKQPTRQESNAIHDIMMMSITGWERHKQNYGRTRCGKYGVQICYHKVSDEFSEPDDNTKIPFQ